jgi:molecular chaperone GrpE
MEENSNMNEENIGLDSNADETNSAGDSVNETIQDMTELEKLKAEISELKDKQLRSIAEFDNFRRRTAKERIELIQTAGKEVITDLLEVLDDCDRAQNQIATTEDITAIRDGVTLIFNKLRTILKNKGLKAMEVIDQEFDADLHEAITELPSPTEDQIGKILAEVEKGYYLNDKIIRHAKVVVGK